MRLVTRTAVSRIAAAAAALAAAGLTSLAPAAHGAPASSLTAGNVVVYRVGPGSTVSGTTAAVFLDEYTAGGSLVQSIGLPTATSGSNVPLTASNNSNSEGLLTLSADRRYLVATGYDTPPGTANVSGTTSASVPRTVGLVDAGGTVNTSTHLTDAADGNNPRSATSNDGTQVWFGGAAGGVRYATVGATTSTALTSSTYKNVRQVSIYNGQLYTSADPSKAGVTIATVGSGLPTSGTNADANLAFTSAPAQPYAYAFVTLSNTGTAPDTVYVADNSAGAIVKYGLSNGSWVALGSIPVAAITGVAARDVNGTVSLFASASGSAGTTGALYSATDVSGRGGTLSGAATMMASSSTQAFRGVAFAPGTTFGTGGNPGGGTAPTVTAAAPALAASINDPTNPTVGITVGDTAYAASQLTVTATATSTAVATSTTVSGSGASRTLTVTPGSVGTTTITITATAPDTSHTSTTITYGVSADDGDTSDRYYAGAGNGSAVIDVGGGYMIVGDDNDNTLRLYHQGYSGLPVTLFDESVALPGGSASADIEAATRVGDVIYWLGSLSTSSSGNARPSADVVYATRVSGSGASTTLAYVGSYNHLREDLISWDQSNGNPLGLSDSASADAKTATGLNVEGMEFAAGSTSTAYLAFRAPLETPSSRTRALLIPVTNFGSLPLSGNPGTTAATFGTAFTWDLGGLALRDLRKNADGQYLAIAGTPDGTNTSFALYTWDGAPADPPVRTGTSLPQVEGGAWEAIVSVANPLASGATVTLLEDNGDSAWYGDGFTSKNGLATGLQKDLGRTFTIAPAASSSLPETSWPVLFAGACVVVGVGLVGRRRRQRISGSRAE